jgi:hypothetical protein
MEGCDVVRDCGVKCGRKKNNEGSTLKVVVNDEWWRDF